ncbi:MAG TPA: ferrochelatase [Polyangiaceae bacterium]|jgi:ferrochelatase
MRRASGGDALAGTSAVLVVSHGTVDDLDDLAAFVTNVRRGHPPSPELVAELARRYAAIGGSPLNGINARVAEKLEACLGVTVAWANRLWRPYARDVLAALGSAGKSRVALVPLAQHSAHVYAEDVRAAAGEAGITLAAAGNWGQSGKLCDAFAERVTRVLAPADAASTVVVMTAHSLPKAIVDRGDPYAREVAQAAEAVAARLRDRLGPSLRHVVAYQSQGFAAKGPGGRPVEWLGPDLPTALDQVRAAGAERVVFSPIGFLADHVEILYDLDVEARQFAEDRGLAYARAPSLDADPDFIDVLADVARPLLADA